MLIMPLDLLMNINLPELFDKARDFYLANKSYCDFVYAASFTALLGVGFGLCISRDNYPKRKMEDELEFSED